jgi:hypothetical protein
MKTILTALALVIASTGLATATVAPVNDRTSVTTITPQKDGGTQEARRKKRIPGGSGCDDAHDKAEHPECNG